MSIKGEAITCTVDYEGGLVVELVGPVVVNSWRVVVVYKG